MDDQSPLPHDNLESLLPGMTRDFKTYVDVLPENEEPRHPGEDPLVRETALHISSLIANAENAVMLITKSKRKTLKG